MTEKKKAEKTPKDFETVIRERVGNRSAPLRQISIDETQSTPQHASGLRLRETVKLSKDDKAQKNE